jgi:hypothetical protein
LRFNAVSVELVVTRVARGLAIVSVWAIALALAATCFFSPNGVGVPASENAIIGFACAFTIAGAAAASVLLAVVGKRRSAAEIALVIEVAMAAVAVLAFLALWVAPWTVRSRMDTWSFLRLRQAVANCGKPLVTFHAPVGLGVGAVVGAIIGKLIFLGRRRPRLAKWVAFGLFVICATDPVRSLLFEVVVIWGMIIDWPLTTSPMTEQHVWAPATILGAITGAFAACVWISRVQDARRLDAR